MKFSLVFLSHTTVEGKQEVANGNKISILGQFLVRIQILSDISPQTLNSAHKNLLSGAKYYYLTSLVHRKNR